MVDNCGEHGRFHLGGWSTELLALMRPFSNSFHLPTPTKCSLDPETTSQPNLQPNRNIQYPLCTVECKQPGQLPAMAYEYALYSYLLCLHKQWRECWVYSPAATYPTELYSVHSVFTCCHAPNRIILCTQVYKELFSWAILVRGRVRLGGTLV